MRLFSVLAFCFLVSSCSSLSDSEGGEAVLKSKLQQMSKVVNDHSKSTSNYNDFFTAYAASVGETVKIADTSVGNVYYFKIPTTLTAIKRTMPKSALPSYDIEDEKNKVGEVFIENDNDKFTKSCNGEVVGDVWFSRVIHQGILNPEFYIDEDKLAVMKDYPNGHGSIDNAPIIASGLNRFNQGNLNAITTSGNRIIRLTGTELSCYESGKAAGYKYSALTVKNNSNKNKSSKVADELIFIYVPRETHERAVIRNLHQGYSEAINRKASREDLEKRRSIYIEQRAKEVAHIDSLNAKNKISWDNRINQPYTNGDMVCNFENFFGYVGESNSKNVKIQLVGKVSEEPGYFFGNLKKTSFNYEPVENTIWLPKSEVASCSFKQKM